jgi:hypothetical protein
MTIEHCRLSIPICLAALSLTVGGRPDATAQGKTMDTQDLAQILSSSEDRKLLSGAAAKLASSSELADHELLRQWLPTDSFLYRLSSQEEYNGSGKQLRLRLPLEALRDNPSPLARETIMGLVRNDHFVSVGSRVELLLEATVSVRPALPELVAFWDKYSQPDDGFTPITIQVLVENGSTPALELFERKLLDPAHEDEEKVSWMRADVLTHRNEVPLLESCERLIKGQLGDPLKSELVDVLFDYRPGEWFRPGSTDSTPPPSSSPDAQKVLGRIGQYALDRIKLTARQRAAVQAALR